MRRQWWLRPVALAMAFWLSLTVGEPGVVHFCPTHGGAPTGASKAIAHEAGHDHATPSRSTPPEHDHAACLCLGSCSLGGFGAALPAADAASVPTAIPVAVAVPNGAVRVARSSESRLLPFANGPPAGLTAA